MVRMGLAIAAALAFSQPACPAPSEDDTRPGITFPFPARAHLVVCVNGYEATRAKLTKSLAAALPKEAQRLTRWLDEVWGDARRDRQLTAVRPDARLFLILHDIALLAEDEPAICVLLPITSYQEFRETFLTKDERQSLDAGKGVDAIRTTAFGDETHVYLVDLKDYVAITPEREVADTFAGKYTPATSETLGGEMAETFLKSDLALYVNLDAINEKYGDLVRGLKGLIDLAIQQGQLQGALSFLGPRQLEATREAIRLLVQGFEDSRGAVAGIEFRPDGWSVQVRLRFADDSATAKLLSSEQPDSFELMARLPGKLGIYQAMRLGPRLGRLARELNEDLTTTEDDTRGTELIEQHLKDLATAGSGGRLLATAYPDTVFEITAYQQPEKAARALTKAYKAVAAGGRVNGLVVKTAPRVADEAQTYRGFTFSSIHLNYDFAASVSGLPEGLRQEMLDQFKLVTPEKAVEWVGADQKVMVRIRAKDWEAAQALLDQYLDNKRTLGAEAAFQRVRERLPREANWLLVADLESVLSNAFRTLESLRDEFPELGRILHGLKRDRPPRSYFGAALTLRPDTITLTAYAPAQTIGSLVELFLKAFSKTE